MQSILIIDDDQTIGNLEQEVLEREGYAVLRAYSGTEAQMLLKNVRPNLILLDLMLPGLSGEELLPQLCGIPVIVVSAKEAVQVRSACFSAARQTISQSPLTLRNCWRALRCG